MHSLSYALVGCGRIAKRHILAVQDNPELKLVGLVDIDSTASQSLDDEYNLQVEHYSSIEDLYTHKCPDVVAIATESGSHAYLAKYALEHFSHLIIEKPMALSIDDCNEIIECAKRANKKVCVCHQNRFNKSMQYVAQLMSLHAFGDITHASCALRWNRDKSYYDQAPWRGSWAHDGGCVMNQCIHILDALLYLIDKPVKSVWAKTNNLIHPYIEGEDIAFAHITFEGDIAAHFEGSVTMYERNLEETLALFGSKGLCKIGGTSLNCIEEFRLQSSQKSLHEIQEITAEHPENVYGFGHGALYKNFIEAIQTDTSPLIDAYAGKRAVELVLAIYQSSRTHQEVKLPILKGASIDMQGFEPWK